MNFEDFEKQLSQYEIETPKLVAMVFQLCIENNSLSQIIIQNQATILSQANPSMDTEHFLTQCNEDAKETSLKIMAHMLSKY